MIVKDFNLQHTIECGQFFRYKKENDFYYIQTKDKIIKIKQKNNQLISNESDEFLINFFNLNQNYQEILTILNKHNDIRELTKQFYGLRIINQDPWECMISYISSSARSIPLIKQSIDLMSKQFGEEIIFDKFTFYTFPKINSLNDLDKLKQCKLGFRVDYIIRVNSLVNNEYFKNLKELDYEKAKQELMKLPGIGPKVADCICLFSLKKFEAFPIDTWIKKYLKQTNLDYKQFYPYQGYAQEFIYYLMIASKFLYATV